MYACTYVCMHACLDVCIYIFFYLFMYVYIYIFIYVYLFMHICMYVCMHACMHACTHAILYVCVSVGCGMILKPRMFLQPKPGDSETKTDDSETKKRFRNQGWFRNQGHLETKNGRLSNRAVRISFLWKPGRYCPPPTAPVAWTVPFYVTAPLVKK